MTDETPEEMAAAGQPPLVDPDDPDDALRRLASMGTPGAPAQGGPAPLPRDPVVDPFMEPPASRPPRPVSGAKRTPRARPRPASGSRSSRMGARIAAPVVFLVAVIALIGIVVNSGVMSDEPAPTPSVKATKTKAAGTASTRKYVVKEGDSLSSIAVRFKTTTAELRTLNPDLSGSTVVIGQRIVVPTQ